MIYMDRLIYKWIEREKMQQMNGSINFGNILQIKKYMNKIWNNKCIWNDSNG